VLKKHDVDYVLDWLPGGGKPFVTQRGRLVEVVSQAIRSHTGRLPELSTTGGTSDARFIAEICSEVVEVRSVAPASTKLNEHIELAALEKLPRIYLDIRATPRKLGERFFARRSACAARRPRHRRPARWPPSAC
jgi:succinyl-diaminopimelate desuccinylase